MCAANLAAFKEIALKSVGTIMFMASSFDYENVLNKCFGKFY
jgi:hypothetical protein